MASDCVTSERQSLFEEAIVLLAVDNDHETNAMADMKTTWEQDVWRVRPREDRQTRVCELSPFK
jgi:hypothetical protein